MIQSSLDTTMARSSSGSRATHELVWPQPDEPRKAQFVLRDEEEVKLWELLGARELAMGSDLARTKARLQEALERVELAHRAMSVDLPRVVEVSSLRSWCLSLISWHSTVVLACLLLPRRAWRRCRPASPGSSGRSTVGWSGMRRRHGGSMNLVTS